MRRSRGEVERMVGEGKLIAVAIDKDKGSQYALKWAVDHLLKRGESLTLLHVNTNASIRPSPGLGDGGFEGGEDNAKVSRDFFLPFRCFCTRKNIQCNEVILHEADISKAISEYVSSLAIEVLVVGAASKSGLVKCVDVPSSVSKGAPEFCSVFVIGKGKIQSVRSASAALPIPSNRNQMQTQASKISEPTNPKLTYNRSSRVKKPFVPRQFNEEEMEFKSPFTRGRVSVGRAYGEISTPESDISFVSSGRPSTDRMSTDISFVSSGRPSTDRMSTDISFVSSGRPSTDRMSTSSYYDSMDSGTDSWNSSSSDRSFGSSFGTNSSFGSSSTSSFDSGKTSWSSQSTAADDVESEMRRLKLELKQTMDMYSTACKEALSAKHKAMELNHWKLEEERRLREARVAEEAALAVAEREKMKCKAALEAAEAAQRIAELEAQKRRNAEKKVMKESEEITNALEALPKSDLRCRKYTIEEIEKATEFFSVARKIGEGGYGPVYKCHLDHTPVAVKVLRPDAAQGRSQFQQEVEILSSIRHPNMVLLLGACPEFGCLVYEYMANGSLEDCLFNRGNSPTIPWQIRFRIAAEIATGLLFLHQTKPEPLVHRDLKPGNILLDRNYVSKISDVGLARLVPPSVADSVTQYHMTSTAGTFCYIDPEYQQTGMLGIKSDVYSLGIMLLQIITSKPPMGLTHHVARSIEKGTFAEMLDQAVPDWPVEEALIFAKLALQCAEMRRKDRPDLGKVVLPELNRLRMLAEQSMPGFMLGSAGASPKHSQASLSKNSLSDNESRQYSWNGYNSSRSRGSNASSTGKISREWTIENTID